MAIASMAPPAGRDPGFDNSHQLNFDIPEALLAEVDFKWLMTGHGWQVDTARLNRDPAYATRILDWAMKSNSPALRECAATLLAHIDIARASDQKPGR